MLFTQKQMLELESSELMYDYLRERSTNEFHDTKRYKEINAEIEERRGKAIDFLSNRTQEDVDTNAPVLDKEEFKTIIDRMMLKALFNLFFTPVDEALLYHDVYRKKFIIEDLELDVEDIEVENRLANPEGNYYKRKQTKDAK